MARPTVSPAWATNVNFAGGPGIGTPTKVAPSAGRFADGWRPTDIPPSTEQNYWQGLIGDWVTWFDSGFVNNGAALAALTGIPDRTRMYLLDSGWYQRNAGGTGSTADGFWVITSADGGQWVHQLWQQAATGKLPAIGPVPGESYTLTTAVGKINPDLTHWQQIISYLILAGTDTTTDTTVPTTTSGDIISTGGSGGTHTIGTLAVGDIVEARLNMVGLNSSGSFQIGAYLSQDNGSTWLAMSPQPGGGDPPYPSVGTNVQTVAAGFFKTITAAGVCKVRWKFNAVSAGTTTAAWTAGEVSVRRP